MVSLVKGCSLFHEIYDNEIEEVIKHCIVASYSPDDYIINQGDESTDICILLSGEADIVFFDGKENNYITTIKQGDIFGELVLINETKRTANIVANKNCEVLIIKYEDFYSFYNKNPKVFSLLVLNITRLVTKRLKMMNTTLQELKKAA
jgi:CRP-like cAMP-binding protein